MKIKCLCGGELNERNKCTGCGRFYDGKTVSKMAEKQEEKRIKELKEELDNQQE